MAQDGDGSSVARVRRLRCKDAVVQRVLFVGDFGVEGPDVERVLVHIAPALVPLVGGDVERGTRGGAVVAPEPNGTVLAALSVVVLRIDLR